MKAVKKLDYMQQNGVAERLNGIDCAKDIRK